MSEYAKSTPLENPSLALFKETNQLSLDECDALFNEIRNATTEQALAPLFDKLLAQQPLLGYAWGRGSFFWRGRKCESSSGWPNVMDLVYPPPEYTRAERLNDAGGPILYASTRVLTVLTELNVKEGDYVHLITIRMKQGTDVHMAIGEMNHVFKAGFSRLVGSEPCGAVSRLINNFGPENARRIVYVDAFLSDLLADSSSSRNGHLHTRALRHSVFRKIKQAEGFFYPSVRDRIGMNLAIKPDAFDAKWQIVSSQVIQITRERQFGFFDFRYCRHAKWFNGDDGSFVWLPSDEPHEWVLFGMTEEEQRFIKQRGGVLRGNEFLDFMEVTGRDNSSAYWRQAGRR